MARKPEPLWDVFGPPTKNDTVFFAIACYRSVVAEVFRSLGSDEAPDHVRHAEYWWKEIKARRASARSRV